jgi:hypothetical protein
MRMVSLSRILLVIAFLAMGGCSKLGDYTAGATVAPVPTPSVSVTVPEPDHEWNFENILTDTGSVGGWNGSFTGSANYTSNSGEFEVGIAAAKFTGAAGDGFPLGSKMVPSEMTVACWVRWLSSANPEYITANSAAGANANGFRLYMTAAGKINLETGSGSAGVAVTSNATLISGTYTHVVAVFDQVLNQSAIYVNGAQDQTGTVQSGYSLSANTFLGTEASNTDAFKGDLDDCRIYSISLSAAQVAILYNSY